MKKLLVVLLVIVALGIGGWAVYSRNSSDKGPVSGSPANNSTQNSNQSQTQTNPNNTAAGAVDIKNMMFTPPQISVQKGATVTWTNNDTVAHTVTDDLTNVGGPDSEEIAPGASYSFTFDKTGSFQYHCKLHPSMRGTIVVK